MEMTKILRLGSAATLGAIATVVFSPVTAVANDSANREQLVAQSQPIALMSGTFVAGKTPHSGSARIVTENGHRYVELSSDFASAAETAPDLHVVLDTDSAPSGEYQGGKQNQIIILGALQELEGAQRYPIPDTVNPTSYKSVAIWCREANAIMGYASLGAPEIGSLR